MVLFCNSLTMLLPWPIVLNDVPDKAVVKGTATFLGYDTYHFR